jgi:hypothetical protein
MPARHVPFLGWRRLPADLSEFEIAHFFTLKLVDIRAVRSGVFGDHLLAATRSAPGSSNCRRSMVSDRSSLTWAPATRMDLKWPKLMTPRGQSDSNGENRGKRLDC